QDIASGRGRVEAAEKMHEGGLAGAGGAHYGHELAATDTIRNPSNRVNRVCSQLIVFDEPLRRDQRPGHNLSRGVPPGLPGGRLRVVAAPASPTITSCPSVRSPRSTSVAAPSAIPSISATGFGRPSAPSVHTRPATPTFASVAATSAKVGVAGRRSEEHTSEPPVTSGTRMPAFAWKKKHPP